VSQGGGFGQIGSGGRTPEDLEKQIQIAMSLTTEPFGVNIPISEHRDPGAHLAVVEKYARSIRAVSLSAGNPRPFIAPLKSLGLVVMTLASTPEQAKKAESAGADIVICEGYEAGGHNGPAELTTLTLIPLAKRLVSIPVIAAGGIADGHTAAAAFSLGADGVQLGTRFVATAECQAHENYKDLLVKSAATDTVVMERSLGRVTRVLKNSYAQSVIAQEYETPGDIDVLLPMISGKKNAVAALEGRIEEGWMNCGQSVGFIEGVESASVVPERIMREALQVLKETSARLDVKMNL
jgi:enoyl-[acyl-carrier protein] reductase II